MQATPLQREANAHERMKRWTFVRRIHSGRVHAYAELTILRLQQRQTVTRLQQLGAGRQQLVIALGCLSAGRLQFAIALREQLTEASQLGLELQYPHGRRNRSVPLALDHANALDVPCVEIARAAE